MNRLTFLDHGSVEHPKQYAWMLKPIEEGGLGLKEVLDYIHVKY